MQAIELAFASNPHALNGLAVSVQMRSSVKLLLDDVALLEACNAGYPSLDSPLEPPPSSHMPVPCRLLPLDSFPLQNVTGASYSHVVCTNTVQKRLNEGNPNHPFLIDKTHHKSSSRNSTLLVIASNLESSRSNNVHIHMFTSLVSTSMLLHDLDLRASVPIP